MRRAFSFIALRGIKVNIPRLIIDFMLSDHLLIPSRNLSYGMILIHLFKHLKINLSDERTVAPSIDINHTLLKRMHVSLRAQAPPHPTSAPTSPPAYPFASGFSSSAANSYTDIKTQLSNLSLHIIAFTEKILANLEAIQNEQ